VYKARPKDTRNAQVLLDDLFTINHVTHVAPHELNPAGFLVPNDSHLENRNEEEEDASGAQVVGKGVGYPTLPCGCSSRVHVFA
jgi:hypothetical protein